MTGCLMSELALYRILAAAEEGFFEYVSSCTFQAICFHWEGTIRQRCRNVLAAMSILPLSGLHGSCRTASSTLCKSVMCRETCYKQSWKHSVPFSRCIVCPCLAAETSNCSMQCFMCYQFLFLVRPSSFAFHSCSLCRRMPAVTLV